MKRLSNKEMLMLLVRKGKPPTEHEMRMILVELVSREIDIVVNERQSILNDEQAYNDAMSDRIYGSN